MIITRAKIQVWSTPRHIQHVHPIIIRVCNGRKSVVDHGMLSNHHWEFRHRKQTIHENILGRWERVRQKFREEWAKGQKYPKVIERDENPSLSLVHCGLSLVFFWSSPWIRIDKKLANVGPISPLRHVCTRHKVHLFVKCWLSDSRFHMISWTSTSCRMQNSLHYIIYRIDIFP